MILQVLTIFIASLLTWAILAVYFGVAQGLSREFFIIFHYIISFLSAFTIFYLFTRFFTLLNPFNTMLVAMISLFIIEIIVFSFFYKEELWFLNFIDWMVPVMIISTTIYFTMVLFS